MPVRRSQIAYVAARLRLVDGDDALLLRIHEKWGDFSLLGGHVEHDELDDWMRAAVRETAEEMEPLAPLVDFELVRISPERSEWGPVTSRSAGGQSTIYEAEWFAVKFLSDPERMLRSVHTSDFAILKIDAIGDARDDESIASVVHRLRDLGDGSFETVPLAWPSPIDVSEMGFTRLGDTAVPAESGRTGSH